MIRFDSSSEGYSHGKSGTNRTNSLDEALIGLVLLVLPLVWLGPLRGRLLPLVERTISDHRSRKVDLQVGWSEKCYFGHGWGSPQVADSANVKF